VTWRTGCCRSGRSDDAVMSLRRHAEVHLDVPRIGFKGEAVGHGGAAGRGLPRRPQEVHALLPVATPLARALRGTHNTPVGKHGRRRRLKTRDARDTCSLTGPIRPALTVMSSVRWYSIHKATPWQRPVLKHTFGPQGELYRWSCLRGEPRYLVSGSEPRLLIGC